VLIVPQMFPSLTSSSLNHRTRILVQVVLAMGLLLPVASAQKPPAPPPSPQPPTTPNRPGTLPPPNSTTNALEADLVMFLFGKVATTDGSTIPNDTLVERVCNAKVRQQVHASSHGDFSMQLGSVADSFLDATGEQSPSQSGLPGKTSTSGIPRRELANCELRATASGFRSNTITLVDLDTVGNSVQVGNIIVQRTAKIDGATLNAAPYKAPKDARQAYEKGLQAEKHDKLALARQYFEQAVKLYPSFATAWFELGNLLQKQSQNDAARAAYIQATTTDANFMPAYLSLATMACDAQDWPQVLTLTARILDHDKSNPADTGDFVVDLDPVNYSAAAYFYNSVANFRLNNIQAAEKSARQAERLDLRTRFPQLHLVLAEIFARRKNNAAAISEIQTYLALVPNSKDEEQLRAWLAKLDQPSRPSPEKPDKQ
jgi:hypothetical protein